MSKTQKKVANIILQNGLNYYIGFGGHASDYDKAFECFKKAALGGEKEAKFWLAKCYQFGNGVKRDYNMANQLFKEVSDYKSIYRGSKSACAVAQYYLSQNYRLNRGVEDKNNVANNTMKANIYLAKSAKNGFPRAQYELGARLLFGKDVPQDNNKAIRYLTLAANPMNQKINDESLLIPGYKDAQSLLGRCYKYGIGVQNIDICKAVVYFHSAAAQGEYTQNFDFNGNYDLDTFKEDYDFSSFVINKVVDETSTPVRWY